VNADLVLTCPACGAEALADDEFCESCGMPLGVVRDGRRNHIEVEIDGAAAVSDRGHRHARNEDAMFLAATHRATVAVVCDGVSTSAAPQVAAQVAAETAGRQLMAWLTSDTPDPSDVGAHVVDAIDVAGRAVTEVQWSVGRADVVPPSCTIVVAVWDGIHVTVGWLGDSRAYWVGADSTQLTADDSVGEHAITRWLGADAPSDPVPTVRFRPSADGRLVLCTDGLWNHVGSVDELSALATGDGSAAPIDIAEALTRCALARGGEDNVTVVVIDVHAEREEMVA
jgi:serine/threonine protein phosphatase PrpC